MDSIGIVILLFFVIVLAAIIYYVKKKNRTNNYLSEILRIYSSLIPALLNKEYAPDSTKNLSIEDRKRILSVEKGDWDDWDRLKEKIKALACVYPSAIEDFVDEFICDVKKRNCYYKRVDVFSSQDKKINAMINSMLLDELRLIDSEPITNWEARERIRDEETKIIRTYPDGYKTFCDIRNDHIPNAQDVIRNQKNIEELQIIYNDSKGYDGWEKKQNKFCAEYREILGKERPYDGKYIYEVKFKKPIRTGNIEESEFKIWQGFCKSFCSCLIEKQTNEFKSNLDQIIDLKKRIRHFYDSEYKQIFNVVQVLKDKNEGDLLVVFIDKSKKNWPKITYNYHYKYFRTLLDESNYKWYNYSTLNETIDEGNYTVIFIFDFITSNEELINNSRLIIEHFKKSVPYLAYYSMLQEYDEQELLEIKDYLID